MSGTHYMKRNDTLPSFRVTGMAWGDGTALSFDAGDTARFNMYSANGAAVVTGGTVVLDVGGDACTYAWQAGDTEEAGEFRAEVEVEFASGGKATWPNDGYYRVVIAQDLDDT